MLSCPIPGALIPFLHHREDSQHRLSTNTTNSATLLPSLPSSRRASSNQDCRSEQDCANQHQSQCQEQISLQVASLIIRPGAVFVWEEKEAGIKRWTDHVRWSPSRVSGAFLVYSELFSTGTGDSDGHASDPLLKQSFASTTVDGDRMHLIAYYSKSALDSGRLRTPARDENLRTMVVPKGVYPDHRATGGVEDQVSRDCQRPCLLPHSSVGFSESSRPILDSATPLLDTRPPHPATLTKLDQVSDDRPNMSGVSHLHTPRWLPDSRDGNYFKYENQPTCYDSFYSQSLAPSGTESHALLADPSRWNALSTWQTSTGSSTTTPETISYPSVTTTPVSSLLASPNSSSISVLGIWRDEQERDAAEKRAPAPATHSLATHPSMLGSSNHHGYHPYARILDHERTAKDRCTKDQDSRRFSYDPTPKTPLHRMYSLTTLHDKMNDGPPLSSLNTPILSTIEGAEEE
ncbi:hypothetical protein PtA15_10A95 [Puccinia triticina]|uniref:Gti1/Pac2 family-domain-containing protein n=1 Tax=Puccinia triticina TaxID=208348 RepID=A0ABY7CX34_9BASI|nr:uncharacterized protein PtA15_10A95 [Puccinia triticina]WAQ88676.1 hypothetical protein PtA15_10A95 [Puccinia triticina]